MFTKIMGDDQGDVVPAYIASEVDARIDELEGSLSSCLFALEKQRDAMHLWDKTVTSVMERAQKTLALRAGS
jgi:hypothetical protein